MPERLVAAPVRAPTALDVRTGAAGGNEHTVQMTRPQQAIRSAVETPVRNAQDRTIALALVLMSLAVRVPLRSQFLVNWDAVNFALGIEEFDLAAHQPHPPGYLGFVIAGRLLTSITRDPNAAMTFMSAVSGAAAAGLMYLLARQFASQRASFVAAAIFTTAPLSWYYSLVALSYMTTGAVALALLLACVVAVRQHSVRALYAAAALLALIGALRPTDELLLAPAVVVAAMGFDPRARRAAATIAVGASLLWALPLVVLAGGPVALLRESAALAGVAGGRTWVLGGQLAGIGQNVGMVAAGILLGTFGGLLVIAAASSRGFGVVRGLSGPVRRLLIAWSAPALLVYLLLHTGQLGYVLLVLPIVHIGVARAVDELLPRRRRRRLAPSATGLVVTNAVAFALLPLSWTSFAQTPEVQNTEAGQADVTLNAVAQRTRQFNLPENDRHWRLLLAVLDDFDPATTLILAETTTSGSFRHLSYYAPSQFLLGTGLDRSGRFGHLFSAHDRATTYSVDGLHWANKSIHVPRRVTTIVVLDEDLRSPLLNQSTGTVAKTRLSDGTTLTVVELDEPVTIRFIDAAKRDDKTSFREGRALDSAPEPRIAIVPTELVTPTTSRQIGGVTP